MAKVLACCFLLAWQCQIVQGQEKRSALPDNLCFLRIEDGSFYIGQVIEEYRDFIDFIIPTGDTIKIPIESIKRVKCDGRGYRLFHNRKYVKEQGSFLSLNPLATDFLSHGMLQVLVGHRVNSKIALGGFVGYSSISSDRFFFNHNRWTIGATGRYHLNQNLHRVFGYASLGMTVPSNNNQEASVGGLAELGIGITFGAKGPFRWTVSLGQHFQSIQTDREPFFIDPRIISQEFNIVATRSVFRLQFELF